MQGILKKKAGFTVSKFERPAIELLAYIRGHPNCRRRCARPTLRHEAKGKADSELIFKDRGLSCNHDFSSYATDRDQGATLLFTSLAASEILFANP
jgi:hypothetical protein